MNDKEIELILRGCLQEEAEIYEYPTAEYWERLESQINCEFCEEFKCFINLLDTFGEWILDLPDFLE